MTNRRKIEVDETTAIVLERRAADRGLSIADLLAELAAEGPAVTEEAIAELDRRWAEAQLPGGTVAHEEVVDWLKTWGTPAYKPWNGR
jgi:predicted transcriptional regulator